MEDKKNQGGSESQVQAGGGLSKWQDAGKKYINMPAARSALGCIALGVGLALFAALFVYAGMMVHSLFATRLNAPDEALLAVMASVGVVFGTLMIVLAVQRNNVRGLAGLYLFIWLLLTLCLVALEAAARGGLLAVPDTLASIGRVIAALLAGIALVPVVTIPLVGMQKDEYPSAAAAMGHYVGIVTKGVLIAASSFANFFFGMSRGMPVMVAVFCAFLLEGSFLACYLAWIYARQKDDVFDTFMWVTFAGLFGVFISLVTVETISTLSNIDVPFLRPLRDVGEVLFISAAFLSMGLTILVALLTSVINVRRNRMPEIRVAGERSRLEGAGRRVIAARMGLGALLSAFRDKPGDWIKTYPERAPAPALMSKDGPAPGHIAGESIRVDKDGNPLPENTQAARDARMNALKQTILEEIERMDPGRIASTPPDDQGGAPFLGERPEAQGNPTLNDQLLAATRKRSKNDQA